MTVKKLVKSTHPILNKTIQPVSTYDQKLKVLLEDLKIHYIMRKLLQLVHLKLE